MPSHDRLRKLSQPIEHYVGVEVAGFTTTGGSEVWPVGDDDDAEFFSVFVWGPDGYAECAAETGTRQRAETIAVGFASLMGWLPRETNGSPRLAFGERGSDE